MPIHDWTRVPSGLFHDFHQAWTVAISRKLNTGLLPNGYCALIDMPDEAIGTESDAAHYARKANRISIRRGLETVVAIIKVLSPGDKDGRTAFDSFVEKAVAFLRAGVHLLVIDLFPPTPSDPQGIHKAILGEFGDEPFNPPAGKPLTLVSYNASPPLTAYIEPVAVGEVMPDMPLFIAREAHVPVPLEATYRSNWKASAKPLRDLLEG